MDDYNEQWKCAADLLAPDFHASQQKISKVSLWVATNPSPRKMTL